MAKKKRMLMSSFLTGGGGSVSSVNVAYSPMNDLIYNYSTSNTGLTYAIILQLNF